MQRPASRRLHIGTKSTGYSVEPDEKYPTIMWRIRSSDGSLSEMANLARAKDAALVKARYSTSMGTFQWK
jgi:hypothetical protein